jgi:hypothetical protein
LIISILLSDLVVFSVGGSCFQNGNNCIFRQLAAGKDIFQMLVDSRYFDRKQISSLGLGQPYAFRDEPDFKGSRAIRALTKDN